MFRRLFVFLIFVLTSMNLFSTVFVETTVEDRLRHSTGALRVQYLGETYKKLPDGQVVTELTVKILEKAGVRSSDIVNHNNFKILVPGGVWQGQRYKVHGVPRFQHGEDSILIVKKSEFGFILPDLEMSKFKEVLVDNEKFYKSSVFSQKRGIGIIKEKDFKKLTLKIFNEELSQILVDKYVNKSEVHSSNKRNPASSSSIESASEEDSFPVFWFSIFLGLFSFIPIIMGKWKKDDNS